MMINPVTLELEEGQDVVFRASDEVLKYIADIKKYRGYSATQAIDYALTDYWYTNFGVCLSDHEETITPERYYQRHWIITELGLEEDQRWNDVVCWYKDWTVEQFLRHPRTFYNDLAEAIVYEISMTKLEDD